MPVDWKRYPARKEWLAIRASIQERAGNKCEWCGVPNGAVGYREKNGDFVQLAESKESVGMAVETASVVDGRKIVVVCCTTAHLGTVKADGTPGDKHDKLDNRPENLAFLCNRCHLRFDADEHAENAARTRSAKKSKAALEAGQMELIEL